MRCRKIGLMFGSIMRWIPRKSLPQAARIWILAFKKRFLYFLNLNPMPSKLHSIELSGLEGHLVEIEVDTRRTLPAFVIVGLPDTAVQEAKERVKSAIKNTGYCLPRGKVIVNLAP